MTGSNTLLSIRGISVEYISAGLRAVRNVSFDVLKNEVLGLVGESGSGKTTLGMAILGSLPRSARLVEGEIVFQGKNLAQASASDWRAMRWNELSYVPQGAMNALNPVTRIREQFHDIFRDHSANYSAEMRRKKMEELVAKVQLSADSLDKFPHELSGGMKQRICIAMAIALDPKLIIADEPTSALDVISQKSVLQMLSRARSELSASMVLIGHDLALQAQVVDRLGIMCAGRLVEIGPVASIFNLPSHPYTRRLLSAVPSIRHRTGLRPEDGEDTDAIVQSWFKTETQLIEVGKDHFAMAPSAAGRKIKS